MDLKEKYEWARHYDILFWTVATIMSTAIGGLLLFLASVKFSLTLAFITINLIILTVYFAASFRELRFIFQDYKNDDIEKLIKNREFLQWWPYVFIFVLLCFYWIWLMCVNLPKGIIYWILIGAINLVFIMSLAFKANGSILEEWIKQPQEKKNLPEWQLHIWAIDILGIIIVEVLVIFCFIYKWVKL